MEFRLSGAASRAFKVIAQGQSSFFPPDGKGFAGAFYAGNIPQVTVPWYVEAMQMISSSKVDRIILRPRTMAVDTYPIADDYSASTMVRCLEITIWINQDYPNFRAPEALYNGVSGSIQITAITDERIRGTFSGTARKQDPESPGYFLEPAVTVTVHSGSFDVPIVPPSGR